MILVFDYRTFQVFKTWKVTGYVIASIFLLMRYQPVILKSDLVHIVQYREFPAEVVQGG